MLKFSSFFALSFVCSLVACGGKELTNVNVVSGDCDIAPISSDAGDVPAPSTKGCAASRFDWNASGMYVCTDDGSLLVSTTLNGSFIGGVFSLVNYDGVWNTVKTVCLTNIGSGSLKNVAGITFTLMGSGEVPVMTFKGPWSDNRVCAEVNFVVGAATQTLLIISVDLQFPPHIPDLGSYQFEIASASDIVISTTANSHPESILGDFPVKARAIVFK